MIAIMAICILGALPAPATADTGVGVDLAEINIDEILTTGNVYNLPAVGVVNTGDRTWFQFDPQRFSLEAGTSKKVSISLHIPQDASPGQYFALIEAHPVLESSGATTIGIAAATKLRFSVSRDIPVLSAIRNFFRDHAPYSYIGVGLIVAVIVVLLLRRFFRFRLRVERR
jgi:hypothetical protein